MIIVLIGPMGCSKTTVGRLLADKLDFDFYDGDDLHPPVNIAKMRSGTPLTENDRASWLEILAKKIENKKKQNENLMLVCSALKQKYRDILGIYQSDVISVFLKGSLPTLKERVASRNHQFMNNDLLLNQLETMEEPSEGLTIDIQNSPEAIVEIIANKIYRDK